MTITLLVDSELLKICNEILKRDATIEEWILHESSDEFQTKNYCGGFDAIENEFTFSYFNEEREEFWFQLSQANIKEIAHKVVKKVILRKAE